MRWAASRHALTRHVHDQGGDYLLGPRANQGALLLLTRGLRGMAYCAPPSATFSYEMTKEVAADVTETQRTRAFARSLATVLFVIGWLFLMPLLPEMPTTGLDPSWRFALNVAVSHGLVFGRDVLFTFGPLGSIYTQLYSPETDHLMMAGSAVYGAGFCGMLVVAAPPRRRFVAIAIPVLIALSPVRDPLFIVAPLLLFFNMGRACLPGYSYLYLKPTHSNVCVLALGTIAVGMIPIIKASFIGVVLPITGATFVVLARKNIRAAVGFAFLLIASTCCWWVISGQSIVYLSQFFSALSPIISGYTEAMSLSDSPYGPLLFAVASAIICISLFYCTRKTDIVFGVGVSICAAWTLFVALKAGFVRHDGHVFISAGALLFVAYLVVCTSDALKALVILGMAVLTSATIVGSVVQVGIYFPLQVIQKAVSQTVDGLGLRFERPADLKRNYAAAVKAIRDSEPLPQVSGTVDIYPYEMAAIFANNLDWSGRPIFQSYSAYTPDLLKKNNDHLMGRDAPDNVFFSLNAIDHRMAAFDDSSSILTLLARYKIVGYQPPYLQMEKASAANGTRLVDAKSRVETIEWNREIAIDGHAPLWISIDANRTMLGRVAETLFKLPQIEIDLTLDDGTVVHHRYIPEIGRSGFIMSPYMTTGQDLLDLAAGIPATATVKSFKLVTRFSAFWSRTMKVRLTPIEIVIQPSARDIALTKPSKAPDALLNIGTSAPTQCAMDIVNGGPYSSHISNKDRKAILSIQGWSLPANSFDARDFDTWVVVTSKSGAKHFFKALHLARPDVASAFKRPDALSSGFSIVLDSAPFGDLEDIRIAAVSKDAAYLCSTGINYGR
ncbi:hypothetical protein AN416_06045 [Paraburkholderia caribensis]|nr:hypothetical protein AN416_06045 [Paraburkholderia caribensis]AUT52566.1 hypothetical protein C2L66_12400 [Paraburkholderia caribensis]